MASNFVVSSLPDYVKRNEDKIVKKMVLGGKTIERINVQTGIKKDGAINILDVNPTLQAGDACGFEASGNTTFTQRVINTVALKYNLQWCPQTLLGKWVEYQAKIAAKPNAEALPFEEYIVDLLLNHANADVEKLIWQGDDSLGADGLLGIALADAAVIDVDQTTATSMYDAILATYLAIPEKALDGAEIYVSPDVYRTFCMELVAKNYFHFGVEAADEVYFPGTDVKVVKTAGLAGDHYILATRPENIYFGCDLLDAAEQFKLWFSDDNDVYRIKMSFNAGVNYALGDEVVLTELAAPEEEEDGD